MAKKKHRNKNRYDDECVNFENNSLGINQNQLMNMMGNLDMNKVNALLESMNKDGVNLGDPMQMINNMNNNNINNNMNNSNFNPLSILNQLGNMNNGMNNSNTNITKNHSNMNERKDTNLNKNNSNINKRNIDKKRIRIDDENVEMLLALRKIVNPERVEFIDKVIKKYNEGIFD